MEDSSANSKASDFTATSATTLSRSIGEPPTFEEEEEEEEEVFYFVNERDPWGTIEEERPNVIVQWNSWNEGLFQDQTWVRDQVAETTTPTENQGLELVSLLTSCAESISSGDHGAINFFLSRLGELASPRGTPIQRVSAYFTEALALRAVRLWPQVFSISPPREITDQIEDDDSVALRLLDQVSPLQKFLHFTLNESLLRASQGNDRIHIIDFDIKEGLQWPSLFQSLASRPNPPALIRITGIGDSRQDLQDTGARLRALAESLNLRLEFHPVVDKLEDVRLWMLHVRGGEFVAVNCILQLHKVLYDDSRIALTNLLALIGSTNPSILLMAEEEAEHNTPSWETRFANSLRYYAAVFDSLDSSFQQEDIAARVKIEEMFARKIRNILVFEGRERIERHEKFDTWKLLMESGGFRCLGFEEGEAAQSRMILRMYSPGESYTVEKRGENWDGLTVKWLDQDLYTVSAWSPISFAGTSSIPQTR